MRYILVQNDQALRLKLLKLCSYPDAILDFFAEYQRLATDVISAAPVLLSNTGQDGTFQPIHSTRLFRTETLKGSPPYINVYPT